MAASAGIAFFIGGIEALGESLPAFLAGLHLGVWKSKEELRKLVAAGKRFAPAWPAAERERRLAQWRRAVAAVIGFYVG